MTARALRGVDMIRAAAQTAPPAIHVLVLDGLPRTGLSVKEVAKISGLTENRVYTEIRNGRLKADGAGQGYVIPVSELAVIASWAHYIHEGHQS